MSLRSNEIAPLASVAIFSRPPKRPSAPWPTAMASHGGSRWPLKKGASRTLAQPLGLHLPLYPLKGYSLDLPIEDGHVAPQASITDFERKVLYARIGQRLRVAAMVDLVGHSEAIDQRRLSSLMRVAQVDMPRAGNYAQAEPWAGLRPATPSGAPVIGPSGVPGLWLNLGHGALGFTFAAGSAQLLATQMNGGDSPALLQGSSFSLEAA